jgi:CRP-like cAMP-binding protein
MLTNYLREHKYLDILQKCKTPEIEIIKICKIFADFAERIDLLKDEILFRIGDTGDKFFLILSGECQILKPLRKKKKLTPKDFLKFLYKLKKDNEIFLLQMCINSNYEKYSFKNYEEFKIFNNASLKIKIRNYLIFTMTQECFNFEKIKEFFFEEIKTFKEFNINEDILKNMNLEEIEKYLLKENKFFSNFDEEEKIYYKYYYIFSDDYEHYYNIVEYENILNLGKGYTFGDYALDNQKSDRTATIKSSMDSLLCYINRDIYTKFILEEAIKIRKKDLILLNEKSPIFRSIKKNDFENHYIKKFYIRLFRKGDIIFNQNDLIDKIIFVKDGELDLFYQGNTFEVDNHIEKCIDQCKLMQILEDKEVDLLKSEFKNPKIWQIKSETFLKQANKSLKLNLKTAEKGDIICLESALLKLPLLYNIQVKSNNCQIYFLELKELNNIISRYNSCKNDYFNFSLEKVKVFFSRIRGVKLHRENILINNENIFSM